MALTIVAEDLFRRALYLIQALAAGETMEPDQANDAMAACNEMIDSWNTESLAVYGTDNDEFPMIPGKSQYTMGPGADFDITRPVFIDDMYMIRQGVTTPVRIITVEEYNSISVKGISQPLIERALLVNSWPNYKITLWPIPSEANTVGFTSKRVLTSIDSLAQVISLPPGYLRALRYCLAVELWPEYPNSVTDIAQVRATAIRAKQNIKVANMDDIVSSFSDIPRVEGGRSWDWRGG